MNADGQILQKSEELNKLILNKWLNQEFLSFPWFFIIFLVIVSYIICFYLMDKKRIVEMLLFGSFVAVAFVVYDTTGIFFGYWANFISVSPIYPNFFGSNFTLIPLFAMLIYQYTSSWRSFILWYIGFAVLFVFGYYNLLLNLLGTFSYLKPSAIILDFTLFSAVGILARWIMIALFRLEAKKGNATAMHSLSKLITKSSK